MQNLSTWKTALDITEDDYANLLAAAEHGIAYLREIHGRSVVPEPAAVQALDGLRQPLPPSPAALRDIVSDLATIVAPGTVANAGGRYFGFVNGGALPAALVASWFVNAWDQNSALYVMSPAAATLEEIAIGWVREMLELPPDAQGVLVTGASMANIVCLAAARSHLLRRKGWNVEEHGLFGAPLLNVVTGDEVHASVEKALSILGLGRSRVTRVATDRRGRMKAEALPPMDDCTILCIQAGNVNTGDFDPAARIIPAAHAAGAWVHVDGAFGLWAKASREFDHLTSGFEEADSWATDAHKWPNAGYDCGIALVRDESALRSAMTANAAYLQFGKQRDAIVLGPDMSRRARGVELWAVLRSLGRAGMEDLVLRTCQHARRFAAALSAAGFDVLNDVVLNQVLVSFGTAEVTEAVIAALQTDGTCWCGGTKWQGQTAMRISVSSWRTTTEDVDLCVKRMIQLANVAREERHEATTANV